MTYKKFKIECWETDHSEYEYRLKGKCRTGDWIFGRWYWRTIGVYRNEYDAKRALEKEVGYPKLTCTDVYDEKGKDYWDCGW